MEKKEHGVRVLHAFKRYLPNSLNWAYRLIEATQGTEKYIYAPYFEKNNFYSSGWRFLDIGSPNIRDQYTWIAKLGRNLFYRILVRGLAVKIKTEHTKSIINYIKDNDIAVVHSHFAPFACVMSEIINAMDVKHVVSFYGYDYEQVPFKKPVYFKKYEELFQSVSAFICEGRHGVETLAKMGCPREKLHVVRLGLNPQQVSFAARVKKKDKLDLVQIASITEKKGHFYTVRAFLEALKTSPDMTLTIVGSPKRKEDQLILDDISDQLRKHDAVDKVKFVSGIDYSKLYDFLGKFDVFIHPSCYASDMDCEGGAPVVLLDCQATGMPVISTTHCDIPDEVIDGKTGFLSREKDIEGLVNSIEVFYRMSNDEFVQFSINARRHIEADFDIENSGKILTEIYSRITKK